MHKILTNNIWISPLLQQKIDHFLGIIVTCSMKCNPDVIVLPCKHGIQSQYIFVPLEELVVYLGIGC